MKVTSSYLEEIGRQSVDFIQSTSLVFRLSMGSLVAVSLSSIGVHLWTQHQIDKLLTVTYLPPEVSYQQICQFIAQNLFFSLAVTLPTLFATLAFIVGRSLYPLRTIPHPSIADPLAQVPPVQLNPQELPSELKALAKAHLNLQTILLEIKEQKRQFLNDISHELRTPLSLVSGYLQSIQRRSSNLTDFQLEALTIALVEIEEIVQLLQDLLDLSRVNSHLTSFRLELLTLDEVVAKAVKMTEKFGHRTIQLETQSLPISVKADRHYLMQILIRLLDAVVKQSTTSDTITLKLERTLSSVEIEITMLSRTPLKNCSSNLSSIESLIEKMGGQIELKTTLEKGTIFLIKFPTESEDWVADL